MTADTSAFRAGVEAQPENLERGARLLRDALGEHDLAPLREGTIVLSGIGASWHALAPAVRALRAAGRHAFAVPASELARSRGLADGYVLVSQSGKSREVLGALEALDGSPVYAVSAEAQAPLAHAARWLPLGPLPDTPISTLAYTSTLQALGLLCGAILGEAPDPAWDALPGRVRAAIDSLDAPTAAFAPQLAAAAAIDAVGAGASLASAGETALLAREGLRLPGYGAETREYLHGPLEAVGEGFCCILFGAGRELELAAALRSYGASVCLVGAHGPSGGDVAWFELPELIEPARVALEIVPVQLLVLHAAAERGLDLRSLRREQQDTKARVG